VRVRLKVALQGQNSYLQLHKLNVTGSFRTG